MIESPEKQKIATSNKTWVIALMGKSGCGKSTILDALAHMSDFDKYAHRVRTDTTRSRRENEKEDAYNFISHEEFAEKLLNGQYLEAIELNGIFYGTPTDEIKKDKINIGIWTPGGVEELQKYEFDFQVMPIYLETSDKQRWLRLLQRQDFATVERLYKRHKFDEEEFYEVDRLLPFYYKNEDDVDYYSNLGLLHKLIRILTLDMEAEGQDL